mmetsp:Transcript_67020/g.216051  ORF Transcript_67020/g.216051 Transcript_67020/m.216051 type:complete len:245 (+) Transcript_67020:289-1023(+)
MHLLGTVFAGMPCQVLRPWEGELLVNCHSPNLESGGAIMPMASHCFALGKYFSANFSMPTFARSRLSRPNRCRLSSRLLMRSLSLSCSSLEASRLLMRARNASWLMSRLRRVSRWAPETGLPPDARSSESCEGNGGPAPTSPSAFFSSAAAAVVSAASPAPAPASVVHTQVGMAAGSWLLGCGLTPSGFEQPCAVIEATEQRGSHGGLGCGGDCERGKHAASVAPPSLAHGRPEKSRPDQHDMP